MNRPAPHIITVIAFLFCCCCCFSQAEVSVKAAINRNKILIGEPITLQLEVSLPAGAAGTWFPLDSMAHFEFIDKGRVDTLSRADTKTYRQTLVITSFDSGRWSIPSLPFTMGNREYLTDSLPVSVAYVNADPKQDYHDIKDIIEVENTATRYINWVLLGLALLSLAMIIILLRKKAARPQHVVLQQPATTLSPLQEAMAAIERLQKNGLPDASQAKSFHTELNDILRRFLYRKTNIATMEKTSGELMLQLKPFPLAAADFTALAQVLRMNDAVKFAKYHPGDQENQGALDIVRRSAEQLDTLIT